MQTRIDALDVLMFLLCASYSAFLEAIENKRRLEPDFVWLEVVLGNLIILLAGAAFRVRLQEEGEGVPTWRDYEAGVARAFIVGGSPVILWQAWQAMVRKEQVRREQAAYLKGENYAHPHEKVAGQRERDSLEEHQGRPRD